MQIDVLLFAAAKESAQTERVSIDVPDQASAADLLDAIGDQVPQLRSLLPSCRLAVDNSYVGPDAPVTDDCEVALIPPVSGG